MKVGITQKAAPIRLCFLILPDSKESLINAMQNAFNYWGGLFSPILPFYEELPSSFRREFAIPISTNAFYQNSFENFDVDVIIYDQQINKHHVEKISGERAILSSEDFKKGNESTEFECGIDIEQVANYFAKHEFKYKRSDEVSFCVPDIPKDELLLQAWKGTLSDEVKTTILAFFPKKIVTSETITWQNIFAYLKKGYIDPLTLSHYGISLWQNQMWRQQRLLYCLDESRLQDIINFWNLRAAGNFVIPIPKGLNDSSMYPFFVNFYESETKHHAASGMVIINCLIGATSSIDPVVQMRNDYHAAHIKATKHPLSHQTWFPRFWAEHEIAVSDNIKHVMPYTDAQFEFYDVIDEHLEFAPLPLPFTTEGGFHDASSYKILIEFSLDHQFAEFAGVLTGLSTRQLKRLIEDLGSFRSWRYSGSKLHRMVRTRDRDRMIRLSLPRATEYFTQFFQNKGYSLKETPNSKLAKEVFKNMEGLHGSFFYLKKERLQIIELFQGGKEVLHETLVGEIKKRLKEMKQPDFFISRLLNNRIIEFGAQIKCHVCEQHGYYLPGQILCDLVCPICRNRFQLPMANPQKIKWVYRGIGPFTRTNKADGVMSVFATIRLFLEHIYDDKSISTLFGFELTKRDQTNTVNTKEIDLCFLAADRRDSYKKPDLIFCECKTNIHLKEIDIQRLQHLGEEFPGAILTFVTLNDSLAPIEISLLTQLVQSFQTGSGSRPRNPVLILTAQELLSPDHSFPLKEYENSMHSYQKYNDFLGALCELTIKKHLGVRTWGEIEHDNWNAEIIRRQTIGNIVEAILNSKKNLLS